MQRQLLVAKVVADQLGQELLGVVGQAELDQALHEIFVWQALPLVAAVGVDQLLKQDDVVLLRHAVAEFLEVSRDQRPHRPLLPMLEKAEQPGAVDQLGRRDAFEEVQRVRLVAEKPARRAGLALRQVLLVLRADRIMVGGRPGLETVGALRQDWGRRAGGVDLAAQPVRRRIGCARLDLALA